MEHGACKDEEFTYIKCYQVPGIHQESFIYYALSSNQLHELGTFRE